MKMIPNNLGDLLRPLITISTSYYTFLSSTQPTKYPFVLGWNILEFAPAFLIIKNKRVDSEQEKFSIFAPFQQRNGNKKRRAQ